MTFIFSKSCNFPLCELFFLDGPRSMYIICIIVQGIYRIMIILPIQVVLRLYR
ncbi:hypothetical protein BDV41DRAFT_527874 [Aspergillus transmontanensis]|uniref:Uncharacterized protein n=1 Tax=Aspergillus transmontanensis TaxID=1034304 RepID=A0A5N6W7V5_9EURO|nr:hypothetical protein BDV41DRAFT_527874 [Aspergillus transmontanensis]